jgi:leader peptidase (prepilin peptidase)/N-methyltransferase
MMTTLWSVLFALLGLAVGSAATHVAEAALADRPISTPRCPYCTAAYTPLQWSATLALLTGQRRCRSCGKPLRAPRLAGELYLTLSWAFLAGIYGVTLRPLFSMVALLPLAMVMVTDLEAKLVPNRIMLPSLAAILVVGMLVGPAMPAQGYIQWWHTPAGAAVGFVVFRLLVWLGVAIFGPGALGEGDITLATYVGGVVGIMMIVEALVLAFALGGLGAFLVILTRKGAMKTAIPYGPFIILGCTITVIWGPMILAWYMS